MSQRIKDVIPESAKAMIRPIYNKINLSPTTNSVGEKKLIPLNKRDPELYSSFNEEEKHVASNINTICIPLGPYRNLTTLLASLFATHFQCLTLNHAGKRILSDKKIDFFHQKNDKSIEKFLLIATRLSQGGRRGDYGGNIQLSHAFDDGKLDYLYKKYKGNAILNRQIKVLFWKESMRITNHLFKNQINPNLLTFEDKKLKYIIPIRNPLDCATSNLKTKHYKHITTEHIDNKINLTYKILDIYKKLFDFSKLNSNAFLSFTEREFNKDTLKSICNFVDIDFNNQWADDIISYINLKSKYSHEKSEIIRYKDYVKKLFKDDMQLQQRFIYMLE